MKNKLCSISLALCSLLFCMFVSRMNAQIIITSDNVPTDPGTCIITQNSIVDSISLDVGSPGENQVWLLDQAIPAELHRQVILTVRDTPYAAHFPNAELAIRYIGNIGDFIDSYYFDNTKGHFFLYQKKMPDLLELHGIGFDTATVNFGPFRVTCSGHFNLEPYHPLFKFPLHYDQRWESTSRFTFKADTLDGDVSMAITADVRDSVFNHVDGWGQLFLPETTYACLRLKSMVALVEKLYVNGLEIRSKTIRTLNYYWISEESGIVAKVSSYANPDGEHITLAKRMYRLHMLNPHICLSIADAIVQPKAIVDVPIQISNVTDLNIRKIGMSIKCDTSSIAPLGILQTNSMTETWREPLCVSSDSAFQVELSGDHPLKDAGVLCYLRVRIGAASESDTCSICLDNVVFAEAGPTVESQAGTFIVQVVSDEINNPYDITKGPMSYELQANYPNPFNESTTLSFVVVKPAYVLLQIFNATGQLVATVADQLFQSGAHRLKWYGDSGQNQALPSGVYFCRLIVSDVRQSELVFESMRKMILLR